ncbi:MAG: YihY/virulence factor BrkB family protein [Paracoccaceae bacterium]
MARGRDAYTPTEIPTKGWLDILWRVKDEVAKDRVGLISAGVAFYGLLALFPALSAIVAVAALFAEPQALIEQVRALAGVIPQEVTEIITSQIEDLTGSRETGLGFAALFGLGLAIYSASKGTASLMEGTNAAYDEREERGVIKLFAIRLGLTIFLVIGACAGFAITLLIPATTALVNGSLLMEALVTIGAYAVVFALTVFGLAVLYRYAPCRRSAKFRWISPGAMLACVLWIIASAGFAFYVGNFATYNETFGALAGVVVLLMWFWISAFTILLGAEFNAEMEAQTARDSTVGQDLPRGERGAVKADTIGEAQFS